MSDVVKRSLNVIDDNPASLDLLGFDAVVAPVIEAIRRLDDRPLTIGIRGGWGAGKSTLLRLISEALAQEDADSFIVILVDPWEFEDAGQLRSVLVETVLTELQTRIPEEHGLGQKVRRLIGRVRFGKIARLVVKGDYTLVANPSTITVARRSSTTDAVVLTTADAYSAPVTLSASGLPRFASASFSPNPLTPTASGATSTLTVSADRKTPTGVYQVTITAKGSDGTTHTTTISLTVQ